MAAQAAVLEAHKKVLIGHDSLSARGMRADQLRSWILRSIANAPTGHRCFCLLLSSLEAADQGEQHLVASWVIVVAGHVETGVDQDDGIRTMLAVQGFRICGCASWVIHLSGCLWLSSPSE